MNTPRAWISFRDVDGSHRLMTCLVLALGLFNVFLGEIVPAGGGFGWDGITYAGMVRNLASMISNGQLSSYYAQRILPSAVVRGMLMVSGAPFSNANIIRAFDIYNLLLLLCGTFVWKRIANHFSISIGGRWIGFAGIFVNFLISKQIMYCPVSTDVTAVAVSMLLLLFYLEKRPLPLFVATIAGSFVWQITGLYGAMLLVLMHVHLPQVDVGAESPTTLFAVKKLARYAAFSSIAVLIGSIAAYVILIQWSSPSSWDSEHLHKLERFLTGAASLVAVMFALTMLVGSTHLIRSVFASWRSMRVHLVILAIAGLVIPRVIVKVLSNPDVPNPSGFSQVLEWVLFPLDGEGKFLMPLVTLTVFWGPAVLLLILRWKDICVELRRLGPGIMGVVGLTLPLGLVTEPRYIIGTWPFVVLALILVLERTKTSELFKYVFAGLTVAYAQFWMKINVAPWTGGDVDGILEFPKQLLFMHYGPWMSWPSYLVQLPVVILSGILLRKTMLRDEVGGLQRRVLE